jgi:hypothetical protein
MIHRKSLCLAVLACFPALPAQADNVLSSSYFDAAYLNSTVDTGTTEDEVEGFRVAARVGLMPFLNFVGDYDQRRYQNSRDSFYSAGLGGHTQDPNWQAFVAVTYERWDFDTNEEPLFEDATDEGYGVQLGGRALFTGVEVHAAYKYLDWGNDGDDVTLTGARYGGGLAVDLSAWWSLTGDYNVRQLKVEGPTGSVEGDHNEWSVGLRRYFVTQTDRRNRTGGVLTALSTALFGDDDSAQ